jgi:hypothetical protein
MGGMRDFRRSGLCMFLDNRAHSQERRAFRIWELSKWELSNWEHRSREHARM